MSLWQILWQLLCLTNPPLTIFLLLCMVVVLDITVFDARTNFFVIISRVIAFLIDMSKTSFLGALSARKIVSA
jgi:hypothetical protein